MYKIAICDDEEIFLESVFNKTKEILTNSNIRHKIDLYDSSEAFLEKNPVATIPYHIILLDINMNGMSGMDLANLIRKTNNQVAIVFITSSPDYSTQGYKIRALHYLLKPVDPNELKNTLEFHYFHNVQKTIFSCKVGDTFYQIPINDIIYIETKGRKIAIYLEMETVFVQGKLSDLESTLPQNLFVRSHQSYLINIQKIATIGSNEIITDNGVSIPVSRANMPLLHQKFLSKFRDT